MIKNIYNVMPLQILLEDGTDHLVLYNFQTKKVYYLNGDDFPYAEECEEMMKTTQENRENYTLNFNSNILSTLAKAQDKYKSVYEQSNNVRKKNESN